MVELQIVVLVVAGSSPVGHPSLQKFEARNLKFETEMKMSISRGIAVAKCPRMHPTTDFFGQSEFRTSAPNFWERIFNDEQLTNCSDLEKLVAGCELIAAVDHVELLLAA
jgi:hypothetical protein